MLAGTFFHTGLGLGFLEDDLDLHLDLAVAGLVTSLFVANLLLSVSMTEFRIDKVTKL